MTDKCPIPNGPIFVLWEDKWRFYGVKTNFTLIYPWLERGAPDTGPLGYIYESLASGDLLFTTDMLSAYYIEGSKRRYYGPVIGTHLEVCAGQPEGDAGRDSRVDEHNA